MKALKLEDGSFIIPSDQSEINGVMNPESWDQNFLASKRIYAYEVPETGENEYLGELYLAENSIVTNRIETLIESLDGIYESKLSELELIKQDLLSRINNALTLRQLSDSSIDDLKELTATLLTAETRVKYDLRLLFNEGDVSGLKSFSFQTEELSGFVEQINNL